MATIKSKGTTLIKKKSGSEGADTTIADLDMIGGINIEAGDIETTKLTSTDGYREFVQGFKNAGELGLGGFIENEAQVNVMLSLLSSGNVETWNVVYPSGAIWSLTGYVKTYGDTEKDTNDTAIKFTATLKLTGKPTFTSGASV